jgi:UDP-3-O-[3-hydroxymyristoyl] glucosamine N-acyltransferase
MPGALTLAQICSRLGGRVVGDAGTLIRQVGTLERAGADEISFLANPRYKARLEQTRAAAVVLGAEAENLTGRPRIVCDNPYAYFARVSQLLNPAHAPEPGIDPAARVAPSAQIAPSARVDAGATVEDGAQLGERVWIGAGCHVGRGTRIGDDSRLYPSVVVYHGCRIGARAVIHSGAVIGADGFGIAPDAGRWIKIPQIGGVAIGDDVEIGANTTVDRGAIEDTVIEDGVKLDNQIQIGHNVRVGAHTAIAGCVGIAGSTQIGSHCAIGGAAMILGHLSIADRVTISACTVVSHSIRAPGGTYTGFFPIDDNASWVRNAALIRHLAELSDRVRALEKQIQGKKADG